MLPPLALADMVAGLYGAYAVMVALRVVERGGTGQVIDLPLLDPIISILGPDAAIHRVSGERPQRTGSRSLTTSPRNVYAHEGRAVHRDLGVDPGDGGAGVPRHRAAGDDRRSAVPHQHRSRAPHRRMRWRRWRRSSRERTLDENMAVFQAAEVTATPVYEIDQLVADEHVQARGVIVEAPDEEAGSVLMHNVIPRLSETPGKLRRPAPTLGQHTREVLREIGYSDAGLPRWRRKGW